MFFLNIHLRFSTLMFFPVSSSPSRYISGSLPQNRKFLRLTSATNAAVRTGFNECCEPRWLPFSRCSGFSYLSGCIYFSLFSDASQLQRRLLSILQPEKSTLQGEEKVLFWNVQMKTGRWKDTNSINFSWVEVFGSISLWTRRAVNGNVKLICKNEVDKR